MLLLLTSMAAFASTNVDDIFLLMLFYGNKNYSPKEVMAGQYLGFIAIVFISLLGSMAGIVLDSAYIGLLGFFPIYLGIKGLVKLVRSCEEVETISDTPTVKELYGPILSVALITFANGGDNIGIYIPLFAPLNWGERIFVVTIFLIMVAVWCWIARYLSKHPIAAKAIHRYGHIVAPFVLIFLGIYILLESGSFHLLNKAVEFY